MKLTKKYLDDLVYNVIGASIDVHKALGPGLLESVYHNCLKHELTLRGIKYKSELIVPVVYKGMDIMANLRCDLLIEDILAMELKAVDKMIPIYEAQLLTYMKLLEVPEGILMNFNVTNIFKEGQKTFVNELYRYLADE